MDHDYRLASYDRTSAHIFNKQRLSKEFRYGSPSRAPYRKAGARRLGAWDVLKQREEGSPRPGQNQRRRRRPRAVRAEIGARLSLMGLSPQPLSRGGRGADSSPSLLAGRDLGWGKPSNSQWWTFAYAH